METCIMWDKIQIVIRTLECYVKCSDKLYGEKKLYYILTFILVSRPNTFPVIIIYCILTHTEIEKSFWLEFC